MILAVVRRLRDLSFKQVLVIGWTILFPPLVLQFVLPLATSDMSWQIAVYGLWFPIAVIAVAFMLFEEKSVARRDIEWAFSELANEIQEMRGNLEGPHRDLQNQIRETDRTMRSAFSELGLSLPLRTVNVSMSATAGVPTASIKLTATNPSKIASLYRSVRRAGRRFWQSFYG